MEWRPFYLRPETPPEGMELPDCVQSRMGEMNSRLKQMAAAYGLEMVFPARVPNTRPAHEATEFARDQGKGLEFHRAVFAAYYARGQDIGQWDALRAVAAEVGLDADEMQRAVEADRYTAQVNALVRQAQEIGVDGVPTYVLNDRYAIVGAQPYEVFLQALEQISIQDRGDA